MWNLRRKKNDRNAVSHVSGAVLPERVRKWRLLVRVRKALVVGWLGSMAGSMILLLLMLPSPSLLPIAVENGMMVTLFAVFFVSLCGLGIFLFRFEDYIRQTFRQTDMTDLGCWIDILFSPSACVVGSGEVAARRPSVYTGSRQGLQSMHVNFEFVCAFVSFLFGSERALRLHERLSCHKSIVDLSDWIDQRCRRPVIGMPPSEPPQYTGIYADAHAALLEQLPQLQEETAFLLNVEERYALYRSLYGNDKELIRLVLRAVPLFGDRQALPFVRPLAEGKGIAADNAGLQTEAQSSLVRLQEILERTSGPKALLRASHAPQAPKEQLLKPVYGSSETPPSQLLRAAIEADQGE
jgi:hypothetical protein